MTDKTSSIYMPVRLSREAVAKVDLLAKQWMCATRAEVLRRLVADAPVGFEADPPWDARGPGEDYGEAAA
jgi:hypothetical protein